MSELNVTGKSLDRLIGREGLSLNKLLGYAVQIADALAKAHSSGITHRDLKPSNIMVNQEGLVKLLDFGLAKERAAQPIAGLAMPRAETPPLTGEGAILGTLKYMAPEQLEGREVDGRTDIFAFGAVMYEMATGRRAFEGDSQASLIAAIIERVQPPISSVRPLTPPGLDRVVASCLAKNPDDRWQSARDLLLELKWLAEGRERSPVVPARGRRNWRALTWALFAVASLVAVVLALAYLRQPTGEAHAVRFQVPLPEDSSFRSPETPVISPNGQRLVITSTALDRWHLWVHSFDSLADQLLPGTENGFLPFWSPDSLFVGFFAFQKSNKADRDEVYLKKINVMSGLSQTVCRVDESVGGGTWGREDIILFSQGNRSRGRGLYRVSAAGGEAERVLKLDNSRQEHSQVEPAFLPDGRHFLYRSFSGSSGADKGAIYLGSLDPKETSMLMPVDSNVSYAPPGLLIYGQQETLLAQRFDIKKLRLTGAPFPVAQQVARAPDDTHSLFSASENGVLVYRGAASGKMQLAWYKRDGARLGAIGEPARYEDMSISPDETRLAVHRRDGVFNIWTGELSNGIFTRLTFRVSYQVNPVWSPDGRALVFTSSQGGRGPVGLYRKVVGGADEQLLFASNEWNVAQQWLRDGSILFLSGTSFYRLWPSGERKPVLLLASESRKTSPHVSSDGRWVAYQSDETGRDEVYVASFPTFTEKRCVSNSGGCQALWRKDGKELFYISLDGKLMSINVKAGVRLEAGAPRVLFQIPGRVEPGWDQYCVTGDGKRFIFLEPAEANPSFTVVLNWTLGLTR